MAPTGPVALGQRRPSVGGGLSTGLVERDHTCDEEHTHPEREHDRPPVRHGFGPATGVPSHERILRVVIDDAVEHLVARPELSVDLRYPRKSCLRLRRDVAPLGRVRDGEIRSLDHVLVDRRFDVEEGRGVGRTCG